MTSSLLVFLHFSRGGSFQDAPPDRLLAQAIGAFVACGRMTIVTVSFGSHRLSVVIFVRGNSYVAYSGRETIVRDFAVAFWPAGGRRALVRRPGSQSFALRVTTRRLAAPWQVARVCGNTPGTLIGHYARISQGRRTRGPCSPIGWPLFFFFSFLAFFSRYSPLSCFSQGGDSCVWVDFRLLFAFSWRPEVD